MSPVKHIRKAAWNFSCIACHLVNLVLAVMAILLGSLAVLNVFQQSIPVPDRMANWIINRSTTPDMHVSWTGIAFDLRGGLYLKGFLIRNLRTEQVVMTAEETFIQWSPLDFLIPGNSGIQEFHARKIDIYLPVIHSPSGLNEPVLAVDHIRTRLKDGFLVLDSLLIQAGGMRLYMNDRASMAALVPTTGFKSQTGSPGDISNSIYPILKQLGRLPKDLKADIGVRWNLAIDGSHDFDLTAFLETYTHQGIKLDQTFGSARVKVSGKSVDLSEMQLQGTLSYLREIPHIPFFNIPDNPVPIPFRLNASGALIGRGTYSLPSDIRLSLHPADQDIRFQHLILSTQLSDDAEGPVRYIIMGPTAFAEGVATFPGIPSLEQLSFPSSYSFRAYLPNWTIYQLLDAPLPDKLLVGTKADIIRFNGSLDAGSRQLRGYLVADGLNIAQTQFAHLAANLAPDPDSIKLDQIRVNKSSLEHAFGSYHHHFPSSRFSLNAAGLIYPASLDAILGDWWTGIFTNIRTSEPLNGDVTVWGHWNDLDSLRSVTEVHGGGASYNGVAIPDLELRVRSNQSWAYLDKLRGRFPEGEISGTIAIRSGISDDEPYRGYVLDLRSTAPWKAVTGASGLRDLEILKFQEGNPDVRVSGTLWQDSGKGFEVEPLASLRLSLQQRQGICRLRSLELRGLLASGSVTGDKVELYGLSGKFADGIFTGHMTIDGWQNEDGLRKHLDIDLINAGYGAALDQLTRFVKMASPAASGDVAKAPGYLDAKLILSFGEAIESYSGSGSVSIRDGQLGTVHMFGELSRLLGNLGLGFTSVEMDTLSLDWKLTGPALNVFDGSVTGPALNLTLAGWVDLETQRLQMKSDLTLFSGLFSKMLTPVSDTFKLSLDGSLEDPDWSIRFNPFGWALNRISPMETGPAN